MNVLTVLVLCVLVSCVRCSKLPKNSKYHGSQTAGCQIHIDQMSENAPLLLTPGTNQTVYPDNGHVITLAPDQGIELSCPGSRNIQMSSFTSPDVTLARCTSGFRLKIGSRIVDDLNEASCVQKIKNFARYTGKTCAFSGREIEVGFKIKDGRFVRIYTSCFDEEARNVIYSRYVLTKWIQGRMNGKVAMAWTEDHFYNLGVGLTSLYRKTAQRVSINKQLGLPDEDDTYVNDKEKYLSKGHLTAKADLFYRPQRIATHHYVNSAPQWGRVNEKNWKFLEDNLRVYASQNSVDLEVITGTYGVATLPHAITHEEVELYLYVDKDDNGAVPVPAVIWKLVYDPDNEAGVVLLAINNPYRKDVDKSVICEDVAGELTWLTFDRHNAEHGYVYACTIQDFKRVVRYLPKFGVKNLLN